MSIVMALNNLLEEFARTTPGLIEVIVSNEDGWEIQRYEKIKTTYKPHLGTMGSVIIGSSKILVSKTKRRKLNIIVMEFEKGYILIAPCHKYGVLSVFVDHNVQLGFIRTKTFKLAIKIIKAFKEYEASLEKEQDTDDQLEDIAKILHEIDRES